MRDMEELEEKTYWDITVNEGSLTQFVLGSTMIILGFIYLFTEMHYRIKYWRK